MNYHNQYYYIVPGDFSAFGETVENSLTRVSVDGSEGIVKTGIGVTTTPEQLKDFPRYDWAGVLKYIAENPGKYPPAEPPKNGN